MSTTHRGNLVPEITYEEHDGSLNAKRVSIVAGAVGNATVNIAGAATIFAVVNTAAAGQASVVLDASVANIGFATVKIGTNVNTNIGLVTVDGGRIGVLGNLTLSDPKTFIGLTTTTLGASPAFVGIVTIANTNIRAIAGNVTLSDSKTFIGLVTAIPAYGSNSTVFTQIISTTGNTTVFVAPASNRFFIKNLHISSLGRSEVEIRSGATTLIPFTSLSTTSGIAPHYGEQGLPARAQADAFVVNLNGGTTISVMANVRFEA